MKKIFAKMLILGALVLTANVVSMSQVSQFDGPTPYPCGQAPLPACQPGMIR